MKIVRTGCAAAVAASLLIPGVAQARWRHPAPPPPEPLAPDLAIQIGHGPDCTVTYEQILTSRGLVWRPVIMCPDYGPT